MAISNNAQLDARINQLKTKVIDESPTKRKENQYPKPAPRVEVVGDSEGFLVGQEVNVAAPEI